MSIEDRRVAERQGAAREDPVGLLTPRELQVLRLIVEGKSNKEIAWSLGISVNMVKVHVSHMLQKLEVASRTQAAVVYVRSSWNKTALDAGRAEPGTQEETKGA